MTPEEAQLRELEDAYEKVRSRLDRSVRQAEDDIRREQELWDTMADIKDDLGLCLGLRCRTESDAAYCDEHK